jgi:hypothetical protein
LYLNGIGITEHIERERGRGENAFEFDYLFFVYLHKRFRVQINEVETSFIRGMLSIFQL